MSTFLSVKADFWVRPEDADTVLKMIEDILGAGHVLVHQRKHAVEISLDHWDDVPVGVPDAMNEFYKKVATFLLEPTWIEHECEGELFTWCIGEKEAVLTACIERNYQSIRSEITRLYNIVNGNEIFLDDVKRLIDETWDELAQRDRQCLKSIKQKLGTLG